MAIDQLSALSHGEAIFRALRQPPMAEPVQDRLRRYIQEQNFQPGDRLPSETELAATLRSTCLLVREALRRGDGRRASRVLRARHDAAYDRFAAWQKAHAGEGDGPSAAQAAV